MLVNATCDGSNCTNIPEYLGNATSGFVQQLNNFTEQLWNNTDIVDLASGFLEEAGMNRSDIEDVKQMSPTLRNITDMAG